MTGERMVCLLPMSILSIAVSLSAVLVAVLTVAVAVAGVPNSPIAVQVSIPLVRGLFYLAAIVLLSVYIRPLLRAATDGTQQIAACAGLLLGAAALGQLILQTQDFRPDRTVTFSSVVQYVALMDTGKAQVVLVVVAAAIVTVAILDARGNHPSFPTVGLALTCTATLALPAVGHAVDHPDWRGRLGVVAMELHGFAAVVWIGGLLAVVSSASRQREFSLVFGRFSTVAGFCLAIVSATGIGFGLLQLDSLPDVAWYVAAFRNDYGRLLCAKFVCVIALSLLGAGMRYRVLPQITAGLRSGFARLVLVEFAVLGVATGIAVVLTRTSIQQ